MHLSKEDLDATLPDYRRNLVNSITGIKPAHLVGTVSKSGVSNLAIFSSIVHLGSDPALVGFITRPDVSKHTIQNILDTSQYTLNHVHESFAEKAHHTSARFDASVSEFDACQLTEEYTADFKAPFVKESTLKIGLKHIESIPISANATVMVVGEIAKIIAMDGAIDTDGLVDLAFTQHVGVTGFNAYYGLQKLGTYPYARIDKLPDFK